ncbi:UNVERIFIED_CONTAM: hypothetical protein Sangu_1456200 [Sesamum angustifolium]|uniref:DNA-directed DNA polymerase n=1 Tax=Sesamum angustifolium TaxID=2727405 RepID=A0AAW2NA66_9LAMI
MQLENILLEVVNTSLYGFAGKVVHPHGMISLPPNPRDQTFLEDLFIEISSRGSYDIYLLHED